MTAIERAGDEGNPNTNLNPNWLPLPTKTAPDPSYPGAHSTISFAGAEVLRFYFGDQFAFDVTSESLQGVKRYFSSFSAAARGRFSQVCVQVPAYEADECVVVCLTQFFVIGRRREWSQNSVQLRTVSWIRGRPDSSLQSVYSWAAPSLRRR